MDYREIVSVTGIGGLYQLLTSKGDGAIVRSLADGKTVFVSARKHQVTPLESIEIYTTGENVRLHNVLQLMKDAEATTPLPEVKNLDAVKSYFATVFPDYDQDRVYTSDLKKMVKWYSLLKGADLLDFSRYQQEADAEMNETMATGNEADAMVNKDMPAEGEVQIAENNEYENQDETAAGQSVEGGNAEEAPVKKTRTKKAAASAAEGGEEAPKKTARKKKTEE